MSILLLAVPVLGQIFIFLGVLIFLRIAFKRLHPTLLVLTALLTTGLADILSSLLSLILPVIPN